MVPDVPGIEVRSAAVGIRGLVGAGGPQTGALAQMGVVQVQAAHLVMMVGGFVHVRTAGHEAERQIDGTATYGEEPTHPAKFSPIVSIRKFSNSWSRRLRLPVRIPGTTGHTGTLRDNGKIALSRVGLWEVIDVRRRHALQVPIAPSLAQTSEFLPSPITSRGEPSRRENSIPKPPTNLPEALEGMFSWDNSGVTG